eukprot:5373707-Alexandrium_andersonii.AAC.1
MACPPDAPAQRREGTQYEEVQIGFARGRCVVVSPLPGIVLQPVQPPRVIEREDLMSIGEQMDRLAIRMEAVEGSTTWRVTVGPGEVVACS